MLILQIGKPNSQRSTFNFNTHEEGRAGWDEMRKRTRRRVARTRRVGLGLGILKMIRDQLEEPEVPQCGQGKFLKMMIRLQLLSISPCDGDLLAVQTRVPPQLCRNLRS
ncbi:hypothetical protein DPEC_G00352020 [Dallia pectoralis]|uniref:Uncharacterized protein n=1 Tax=Dallia pectoralis TaxID=75939 RepID=A0ACC2F274_DALPE|nr:hypothetical protein DPEC_G00352020 [Dallia pectoralis]